MNKKIERKSNFELLRIICMIMIVILHTLGHGGALDGTSIGNYNFIIVNLLESISIVGVNCYVIISGFFNIKSSFRLHKILKIYVEVIFYSVSIFLIFFLFKISTLTLKDFLQAIFPIIMQTWWFVSIFLVLYILSFYINKLLIVLSLREYTILNIVMFLVFVMWPSIPKAVPIDNESGYSLYYFIFLYIIGAYIRLFFYDLKIKKTLTLSIYIVTGILLALFNIFTSYILDRAYGKYSYNFGLVFIMSVALFLFFKEIEIKNTYINKISSLTFGVYLIHDNPLVRNVIYKCFNYKNYFNKNNFLIYTIAIVLFIFICSILIELLRKKFFEFLNRIRGKYE
ncbi:acyltransferase [Clostridium sp.]|uniref:acyltransferase n=1 Tax=Clostridium sp. TaxID=1506 RepID=UPI00260525CE|nr:acyltransferase [Clostridium sp.]